MSYPSAPWELKGYAIQTIMQLVDIDKVRPLIPPELKIVSIWPGKTLGGVYISSYSAGSVMEYNELIIVAAMVNYSGKLGSWISHIYVDNSDSVAGGREIWGLPKEMAEFTWQKGNPNHVIVRQDDRLLCQLTYSQPSWGLPVPLTGTVFSSLDNNLMLFKGEFSSRIRLVTGELDIPNESPFAGLNLTRPWLTIYCDDLRLLAGAPTVLGRSPVIQAL